MAEEEQPKNSKPAPAPKKKRPIGLIIGIAVGLVAATAGGAVAGPMLTRRLHAAPSAHAAPKPAPDKANEPIGLTANFEAIVIDLYDVEKVLHHLKVGLTVELHDGIQPEEFTRYAPRGREAAISYLRALTFEEATNPKAFAEVRERLSKSVREAVGRERINRVDITDYVAQ